MATPQEQLLGAIRPTLFIGLGGTGKEVLLRLRRKFYERLGRPGLPCTAYLWLDTDTRDVMALGEKVDEIYQAVAFESHEKIGLLEGSVGSDLGGIFRNEAEWAHLHKWLYEEVGRFGTEVADGAGGVRSVGRLTFFYHFADKVKAQVRDPLDNNIGTQEKINETLDLFRSRRLGLPQFPPNPSPQVFIVSSLAGGTGCGTVLDTVFLLKYLTQVEKLPIERIMGILFMPNVFYKGALDEVSKRSFGNAYAALKELEFYTLRLNQHQDLSVDYTVEWEKGHARRVQGPPFNIAYIQEMKNEAGIGLQPHNRAELFSMVAESLLLDFMPGPFSTQKRSQYSNIVQYLSGVQGANIAAGGVTLPQEFARRYASFGMSKIEIPLDTLKAAAAARLAYQILRHINRESSDEHIKTNVLNDMAQHEVDELGIESRYGLAWKDSITGGLDRVFHGLDIRSTEQVEELDMRLRQFEEQQIYAQGTDSTRWGAAIDIIKKSTPNVSHGVRQALLKWIDETLEHPARGLRSLIADDGYLLYLTENIRGLYAPRGEGTRAAFDELADAAARDAELYAHRKAALLRELRETIESWGVAALLSKDWAVSKYLERLRDAEEQYALASAARVLYAEAKHVAESAVNLLSQQRPAIDAFARASAVLQQGFDRRFEEFLNFGDQVLFIRFFDRERDWDAFYRLDVDEHNRPKEVDAKAEYERFMGANFGGGASLTKLIELFGRRTEKEVRQRLSKYSEERFWSDFEAHPREVNVLEHAQMRQHWGETIERMVRSAMPMIRRSPHLAGRALEVQRRAYLGINQIEGGIYEEFIDEVRKRLTGLGYNVQEISVQPTEKPWEVYLYLVSYSFPLPALPVVANECHKSYFDFYQALREDQIGEARYHIPLHLSKLWEGKFEDLVVYTGEEAAQVKEAREVILFGSILKILGVRETRQGIEYSYRLGAPFFRNNSLGSKREAIESLRGSDQLREILLRAVEKREGELTREQLQTYYWIVQYLLFGSEYSKGSPERTLLDERLKRIFSRLKVDHNVPEEQLSFGGQAEELNAATAKQRADELTDWVGPVPVLRGVQSWEKATV
jgi:hypothetical protein